MEQEDKIPTAQEVLIEKFPRLHMHLNMQVDKKLYHETLSFATELSKMHVKKALEEANKVHEDQILTCYNLTNIK